MGLQKGLFELYKRDPDKADYQVFGRVSDPVSRRGFLKGLGAMSAILGGRIAFAEHMPAGLIPALFSQDPKPFVIEGKHPGLTVLNDRPVNAETPPHLLNDAMTPADRLFVRNNGLPPEDPDEASWVLRVEGESCLKPKTFSLKQLKSEFETVRLQLVLECGGNGRAEFFPPASGNQWTLGAVGCPRWTGVRLADVLKACGVGEDAVYVGYYGADKHLSGNPDKKPISRGVPIAKALEPESLIAWEINGEPLPVMNGFPLRLVFGGWPGSTSGKWLERIVIRNKVHDGPKMMGKSYRVPCTPVGPGDKVADEDMCIIESMPVKSLITSVASGFYHPLHQSLVLGGHAWAGDHRVARVDVSIDYGQTWQQAVLEAPVNRLAWQQWRAEIRFPQKGYYELWARATDTRGVSQPMLVPGWNPKGYLNNACHRVAVRVQA